ncbi:MAG: AtpZ/AtpI family protein [Desulfobacterales bacterium]|nr:AtpZ/AtpI family protein [Desulfobacterales bacterium]
MQRETRRYIRDLAYFGSLGFQIALPIVICYFIGNYLDEKVFHSSPWAALIFLVLGIAAGFRNIALAIKKIRKF